MSAVGSLIFCTACGNLLDNNSNQSKHITCSVCDQTYSSSNFTNLKVITKSHEDAFPSAIKLKRSAVKTLMTKEDEAAQNGATIEEICPRCGNDKMTYHTLQLRSADEGATVFYTCTKCSYKYKVNN